jgi:hypothetical protein
MGGWHLSHLCAIARGKWQDVSNQADCLKFFILFFIKKTQMSDDLDTVYVYMSLSLVLAPLADDVSSPLPPFYLLFFRDFLRIQQSYIGVITVISNILRIE